MKSTEAALRRHFEGEPCLRIALECGTHSPWVSRLLTALGHQVTVANAPKIPATTGSESKNDRNDAEKLARFAAYDPKLLSTRSCLPCAGDCFTESLRCLLAAY